MDILTYGALSKKVGEKLSSNQGTQNAGKMLGINNEGEIQPIQVLGGNVSVTETLESGEDYSMEIEEGEPTAVNSVAGKYGTVTLDAGDIEYDEQEVYNSGTVGKEVGDLKSQINSMEFADGCLINGTFIREANITDYNKVQNDGTVVNKSGGCLAVVDVNPEHTYKVYRSNATDYSFSGGYATHLLIDGEYYDYSNAINTQNTVKTFSLNATQIAAGVNQIRLVLVMAEVDDSYVYDDTTGEVCFAGKNTVYYGKKYIDGHVTDTRILTDKNLDEIKPGIIIGTNGSATLAIDGVSLDGKRLKLAEGAIEEAFFDTTIKITDYNKVQYDGNVNVKNGGCLATIDVDPTHHYVLYRTNTTEFSFGGATAVHFLHDGVYVSYSNTYNAFGREVDIVFNATQISNGVNQIRVGFVMTEVDNTYVIDKTTGRIVVAGKSTSYYGKRYADGHVKDAMLLSNKNLDSANIGLIVGKDGKVHLSINELAVDGSGVKIAESALEDAMYETIPRIAEYGVRGYGDSVRDAYALTCLTQKYKFVDGQTAVTICQAKNEGVDISWNGRNVVSFYSVDTFVGYVSITGNMNEEHKIAANASIASDNPDSFSLGLVTESIDDSYAYDPETGYIYFAGKNTPYYGLKNIFDATPATGLSATIETIDGSIQYSRNGSVDMIPLFLTTDQHSASVETVMEIFLRHASMDAVSKILNLGDAVGDHWIDVDPEKPLWECKQLVDYARQTKNIPDDKRIDVIGNHDTWYIPDGGTIRWTNPLNHLYKYFCNPTAHYHDNYSNFTVVDPHYNVKYMVIAGYEYSGELTDYTGYKISSASLDWMVEEMSRDDGYDIIILSHQPLGANGTTYHNPVANNDFTVESIADFDYTPLWIARKNKTSGTITDASGVSHSYDFTGCKTELICGLHGHQHKDGIAYLGNSLCDLIFHTFSDSDRIAYYFVIDRTNQQVNVWRISTSNNTYTNYQLPLAKP